MSFEPFILFTRQNCTLCAHFELQLRDFLGINFTTLIHIKDVDTQLEWQKQYGNDVPVLCSPDGVPQLMHHFDKAKIAQILRPFL